MSENGKHIYECMFILDARTAKKDYESLHTELTRILTKYGVEVAASHAWGERRLAYEIRRQKKGFYVLMHVQVDPQALPELRRDLRLYEPLLRQLFLRIEAIPETFEFPADPEERRDFRRDDRRGGEGRPYDRGGDSRRSFPRRDGDRRDEGSSPDDRGKEPAGTGTGTEAVVEAGAQGGVTEEPKPEVPGSQEEQAASVDVNPDRDSGGTAEPVAEEKPVESESEPKPE